MESTNYKIVGVRHTLDISRCGERGILRIFHRNPKSHTPKKKTLREKQQENHTQEQIKQPFSRHNTNYS